mmetsp:Transcript_36719/g.93857  ORF Transcript_36719/g.93857 Transcript_36719/m.93857 type:complete len:224 (+) Transcript_36719:815-1486(+)
MTVQRHVPSPARKPCLPHCRCGFFGRCPSPCPLKRTSQSSLTCWYQWPGTFSRVASMALLHRSATRRHSVSSASQPTACSPQLCSCVSQYWSCSGHRVTASRPSLDASTAPREWRADNRPTIWMYELPSMPASSTSPTSATFTAGGVLAPHSIRLATPILLGPGGGGMTATGRRTLLALRQLRSACFALDAARRCLWSAATVRTAFALRLQPSGAFASPELLL